MSNENRGLLREALSEIAGFLAFVTIVGGFLIAAAIVTWGLSQ